MLFTWVISPTLRIHHPSRPMGISDITAWQVPTMVHDDTWISPMLAKQNHAAADCHAADHCSLLQPAAACCSLLQPRHAAASWYQCASGASPRGKPDMPTAINRSMERKDQPHPRASPKPIHAIPPAILGRYPRASVLTRSRWRGPLILNGRNPARPRGRGTPWTQCSLKASRSAQGARCNQQPLTVTSSSNVYSETKARFIPPAAPPEPSDSEPDERGDMQGRQSTRRIRRPTTRGARAEKRALGHDLPRALRIS